MIFFSVLIMHQIETQDLIVWELTKVPNHLRVFGYYYLCPNMKKEKNKIKTTTMFPIWVNPILFLSPS